MSNLSEPPSPSRKSTMLPYAEISVLQYWLSVPFIILIKVYRLVSPVKQLIFGPYARCRFHPTCSEFALECFKTLPVHLAIFRSLSRISRCNPMHPGGHDPVRPKLDHSSKASE